MALSKRFLGLGFTFSATDKGLEKKLKSVQSSLEGIDTALKSINSSGSSATSSIGQFSKSQKTGRVINFRPKTVADDLKKQSKPMFGGQDKSPAKVEDVQGKRTEEFFRAVGKKVFKSSSDMFATFMDNIKDIRVNLDQNGDILAKDKLRLLSIAKVLEKTRKKDESLLFRTQLTVFFKDTIPRYIKDVGNSVENFFRSVGLDVRALVPEQIKALAQVVNQALVKPLLGVGKKLLDLTGIPNLLKGMFGTPDEKNRIAMQKELKSLQQMVGGTGQKSTNSLLKKILGEMQAEDKSGGFLKYLIAAGALLAGIVIGFAEKVKAVATGFKTMLMSFKAVRKVVDALKLTYAKSIEGVAKFIGDLTVVKKFRSAMDLASSKLAIFKDGIGKIITSVQAKFAELKAIASMIGNTFKAVITESKTLAPVIKFVKGIFSEYSGVASRVGEALSFVSGKFASLGKLIMEAGPKIAAGFIKLVDNPFVLGFLKIGKAIGSKLFVPLMLLDIFQGFSKAFEEESNKFIALFKGIAYAIDNILLNIPSWAIGKGKELFGSTTPEAAPKTPEAPVSLERVGLPVKDNRLLNTLNNETAFQTELQTKQVNLAEKQNMLMQQLLQAYQQNQNLPFRSPPRQFMPAMTDGSEKGDQGAQ